MAYDATCPSCIALASACIIHDRFQHEEQDEITRLRAEVARLTREVEEWTVLARGLDAKLAAVTQERDVTRAAWQALRAQVEEWRARAMKLGWVDDGNV